MSEKKTNEQMFYEALMNRDPNLLDYAERMVNNFSFHAAATTSEFGKYGIVDDVLNLIAAVWIEYYGEGYGQYRFDGRNELAVKCCNDICDHESFKKYFNDLKYRNLDDYMYAEGFVESSLRMHRTLMQAFTKFLFAWIKFEADEDNPLYVITQNIFEDDHWWNLPMI